MPKLVLKDMLFSINNRNICIFKLTTKTRRTFYSYETTSDYYYVFNLFPFSEISDFLYIIECSNPVYAFHTMPIFVKHISFVASTSNKQFIVFNLRIIFHINHFGFFIDFCHSWASQKFDIVITKEFIVSNL